MAPALIVTDQVLDELMFALRTTLEQVRPSELPAPEAREHYKQVRLWLTDAERFRAQNDDGSHFVRLRPFPLSGTELRALQGAVERAAQGRAGRKHMVVADAEARYRADLRIAPPAPHQRLLRGIRGLHISSAAIAAILALSLGLNVAGVIVVHIVTLPFAPPGLILGINGVVTAVALGLWVWHQWHLIHHVRNIHWQMPHLTHHWHLPNRPGGQRSGGLTSRG